MPRRGFPRRRLLRSTPMATLTELQDQITVKSLDPRREELELQFRGSDRTHLIADVASRLEEHGLYVAAIAFNLGLPTRDEYSLEVLAKGTRDDLAHAARRLEEGDFLPAPEGAEAARLDWLGAPCFHLSLSTPDRPGLTAKVAAIVGKRRTTRAPLACPRGSFVHLLGATSNCGGPQGGTPYFTLRATVACPNHEVLVQIFADLQDWAQRAGLEGDLFLQDLTTAG